MLSFSLPLCPPFFFFRWGLTFSSVDVYRVNLSKSIRFLIHGHLPPAMAQIELVPNQTVVPPAMAQIELAPNQTVVPPPMAQIELVPNQTVVPPAMAQIELAPNQTVVPPAMAQIELVPNQTVVPPAMAQIELVAVAVYYLQKQKQSDRTGNGGR